ncbi:MAG: hypothetical protein ACP5MD_05290, partial [Verrucomicrobiia bacterium]
LKLPRGGECCWRALGFGGANRVTGTISQLDKVRSWRFICTVNVSQLMMTAFSRFYWGFLGGTFMGLALLVFGLFAWRIGILTGLERDKSFSDLFLMPLCVLSFGLAGGVFHWMRKENSRWHESALAYVAGIGIFLLPTAAGAALLGSGRASPWFCGAGAAMALGLLVAVSVRRVRMDTQEAPRAPNPFSLFWSKVRAGKRELGWMFFSWISLSLALVVSSWFYHYRIWTQTSMETWASYAGALQARVWYQEGRYRLLELSDLSKTEFTGRTNGPFEIWTWPNSATNPMLTVTTADKAFVDAFNRRMSQLVRNR